MVKLSLPKNVVFFKHMHMGSFPQPRHFFAAAQENEDLRTPCRGPSSPITNTFLVDHQNLKEPNFYININPLLW